MQHGANRTLCQELLLLNVMSTKLWGTFPTVHCNYTLKVSIFGDI